MNSHCLPTSKQVRRQRHYSCFHLMFGGWELPGLLLLDCFCLSSGNCRALLALSPARHSRSGENSVANCKPWALQSPTPAASQPGLPTCLVSILQEARARCSCCRSSPISCLNCIIWREIKPCLPRETFPAHSKVPPWGQLPQYGHTPPPDHTNLELFKRGASLLPFFLPVFWSVFLQEKLVDCRKTQNSHGKVFSRHTSQGTVTHRVHGLPLC